MLKLLFLSCLFSFNALSSEKCPDVKSFELNTEKLVSLIKNESCQIKTINDLLKKLPAEFKTNPVLVYESRSLQGPHKTDYQNPRAILHDVDSGSKFVISFNEKESGEGSDSIEIFDATDESRAGAKMVEIKFPDEKAMDNKTWRENQNKISVKDETQGKCLQCHGDPARPIFSSYPNWHGVYGSEFIGGISDEESQGFKKFVEKVNLKQDTRYRNLIFKFKESNVEGISDFSNYPLDGNINFNKNMSIINFKNFYKNMMKDNDSEAYRYVMAASLGSDTENGNDGCENLLSFIPPEKISQMLDVIDKKDHLSKKWTPEKIKSFKKSFDEDFRKFRLINGFDSYAYKDPRFEMLLLDTVERQGTAQASIGGVLMRLIFEGRGIDISSMPTDLDSGTYRTSGLSDSKVIETYYAGEDITCATLKKKSLAAIKALDTKGMITPTKCNQDTSVLPPSVQKDIEKITDVIKPKDPKQMFQFYCSQCHSAESKSGLPVLPLVNSEELANYKSGFGKNPIDRLKERIMPPSYADKKLSDQDRAEMIEYLKGLKKK